MKNLIFQKQLTLHVLHIFIGIFFLLFYAIPCSAQSKKTTETYKTIVQQADKAFAAQHYTVALPLYEKANQIKPEYNYPIDKISQIKKILEAGTDTIAQLSDQSKKSSTSYKTLVARADYAFTSGDYAEAMLQYDKAYQTKPDYNYASGKIDEINKILDASPESRPQLYEKTIQEADNLFGQKNLQLAKSEYQKALLLDATAQLPKDKLEQISNSYIDPDDMGNFNIAIANGDKQLAISDFDHAILYYEAALKVHPNAKFVNKKINEVKKQQSDFAARTEQSAKNIASADKQIQSGKSTEVTQKKEIPETVKTGESQLQPEQQKYESELESAEKLLKSAKYEAALLGFKSASAIKPAENYPKTKITEIERLLAGNTSGNYAFDIAIKNGDQLLSEKKYDLALSQYRNALSLLPEEKYPAQKIEDITAITGKQRELDENFRKSITEADQKYNENRFEDAISSYTKAIGFKPAEAYPAQKITEIQDKLAAAKTTDKYYASAIANGDKLYSVSKYNEALNAYKQALSYKPNEAYPIEKTAIINALLAKQKSDSDNYAQAIRTGEKALATGNYNLALTSFQDAQKIKPSELYPQQQIIEIKAETANQQRKEAKYTAAIKTGDQMFAGKEYRIALSAYTEAAEIKKNEKYPQDQIAKINTIIADTHSSDDNYAIAIAEGDKLSGMKDYAGAKSAYAKAAAIKQDEVYPGQRINEINKITEEITLARSSEYSKALEIADKLYSTKVFDQAIDAYEAALKINPGDSYPELQIGKIRKYLSDHAILDLFSQALIITMGGEKKFVFSAIDPSLRKNNYILLKARSTGTTAPKVYLNYGKDGEKNGGIVLRNLDKLTISDYLISISIQDKWFREENNWISISVETGEIEITKVQIAAGE